MTKYWNVEFYDTAESDYWLAHNATVSSLGEAADVADGRLIRLVDRSTKAQYDAPENLIATKRDS
jgi:hypothetical protein